MWWYVGVSRVIVNDNLDRSKATLGPKLSLWKRLCRPLADIYGDSHGKTFVRSNSKASRKYMLQIIYCKLYIRLLFWKPIDTADHVRKVGQSVSHWASFRLPIRFHSAYVDQQCLRRRRVAFQTKDVIETGKSDPMFQTRSCFVRYQS
jgi:hypothetical protein